MKAVKSSLTLAGAMSTARLGKSLVPLIDSGIITGISCTGANLEEDLFLLTANSHYHAIDNWRDLTSSDDADLFTSGMNRVTDVCIPEEQAIRGIEAAILPQWQEYSDNSKTALPHEFFYQILLNGELDLMEIRQPVGFWQRLRTTFHYLCGGGRILLWGIYLPPM